jgi:nicotinate-nucleotide adenylyltransferase
VAANRCITKVLVALYFFTPGPSNSGKVAVFPGAWNPPTLAHLEIARVARNYIGEVIWVLPRLFPHKSFEGATFEARCRMLEILVNQEPGFSAAISEGGLYAEIADEAREYFGPAAEIALVCGRDAAERIAAWDYGSPGFFDDFVRRYKLLVAARTGEYEPAEHHRERMMRLPMSTSWDDVSSSEVRRRIAAGEDWRALVPPAIADIVETLY